MLSLSYSRLTTGDRRRLSDDDTRRYDVVRGATTCGATTCGATYIASATAAAWHAHRTTTSRDCDGRGLTNVRKKKWKKKKTTCNRIRYGGDNGNAFLSVQQRRRARGGDSVGLNGFLLTFGGGGGARATCDIERWRHARARTLRNTNYNNELPTVITGGGGGDAVWKYHGRGVWKANDRNRYCFYFYFYFLRRVFFFFLKKTLYHSSRLPDRPADATRHRDASRVRVAIRFPDTSSSVSRDKLLLKRPDWNGAWQVSTYSAYEYAIRTVFVFQLVRLKAERLRSSSI